MSEMIIVECDYKDGECSERFEGFSMTGSTDSSRRKYLQKEGWSVNNDEGNHYCPKHKEHTEPQNGKENIV